MKKVLSATLVLVIGLLTSMAAAEITNVTGPISSPYATAPAIIGAPTDVLDDIVTNTGMQGFDEAKVVTTAAYNFDSGSVAAGTLVSSHMIFLNSPDASITHTGVVWTFLQPILGVMSDADGNLEAASTPELGAPGTNYTVAGPGDQNAPFTARGLEGGDSYVVDGNQITVNMSVSQPGDWIRIVTCAQGSKGFWKNNPDAWPVGSITIGGTVYTKSAAIGYMKLPVKGNKTRTMFPQVVAAKLNVMTAGCPHDCIDETITAADAWMASHPVSGPKVKANSDAWNDGEPLYEQLDAYNNGELTCPEPD